MLQSQFASQIHQPLPLSQPPGTDLHQFLFFSYFITPHIRLVCNPLITSKPDSTTKYIWTDIDPKIWMSYKNYNCKFDTLFIFSDKSFHYIHGVYNNSILVSMKCNMYMFMFVYITIHLKLIIFYYNFVYLFPVYWKEMSPVLLTILEPR